MPDSSSASDIEHNIPRRAFLRLTASALAAAATSGTALSSPVFRQSQASTADFLDSVGVNVHLGRRQAPYVSAFEKVAPFLNDIGIRHLRDDAIYASYVNRDHEFYRRVRLLAADGFRFDLVCQDALNGYIFTPPRKLPDIYDWCDRSVEIFEGANEPNLTRNAGIDPAISADHQRSIYSVAKNTPDLKDVIVASPSYIQKSVAIAENLSDAVDWINIHPYPGMEHPETTGPGALSGFIVGAKRIFGDKPVLVSETGYNTAVETTKSFLPVSESTKARYLPRMLLWNFMNGVRRTYLYELIDSNNNGLSDTESNFGVVDFSCNPKASYLTVREFLALFRTQPSPKTAGSDMQFRLTGDVFQDLQIAGFKRGDGSLVFFAWLGVSGWDQKTRQALPPVERNYTLATDPAPRAVVAHRFRDDGLVTKTQLDDAVGGFDVTISDQLTALEIAT
jgi:hypothetical protein